MIFIKTYQGYSIELHKIIKIKIYYYIYYLYMYYNIYNNNKPHRFTVQQQTHT